MIKIYTSPSCSSCRKVKKWFNEQNIPYVEKNIFAATLNENELKEILIKSDNGTEDIISPRSKILKESGCDAVKLEGGEEILPAIRHMIQAGVPVMGHLGLTPQSVNQFGGYGLRAKEEAEAEKLLHDAQLLDEAGCFSIVLEKIPAALAERVTAAVSCPVIGIGAGNRCDGQVLVLHDMLGLNQGFKPKFLRQFAHLAGEIKEAVGNYVDAVKDSSFPSAEESY